MVVILSVLLLAALSHICYNKFMVDDDNNKEVVKPQEQTKLTESEVKELYSTLMTKDNSAGFYSKNNITIDSIDDHLLLQYALINYSIDNDVKSFDPLDGKGDKGEGKLDYVKKHAPDSSRVSEEKIIKYIKDNFNTNKNFIFEAVEMDMLYSGKFIVYDKSSKSYVFYIPHLGAEPVEGASEMIKYEQEGDNLYIYDKAVFCHHDSSIYCYSAIDESSKDGISPIAWVSNGPATPSNLKREDVNPKYIIENMNDKLYTYKHTFKKADNGKYYWYSTEVVK